MQNLKFLSFTQKKCADDFFCHEKFISKSASDIIRFRKIFCEDFYEYFFSLDNRAVDNNFFVAI